jgi:hypothetical protein
MSIYQYNEIIKHTFCYIEKLLHVGYKWIRIFCHAYLHVNRLLLNIEEKSLLMNADYIHINISWNTDFSMAIIFPIFSVDQYRCIRIEMSGAIWLIY